MARLWELPSQRLSRQWPMPAFQSAVFADAESLLLASISMTNEPAVVRRVDLSTPNLAMKEMRLGGVASPSTALCLSADGAQVFTGHADGTIAVWGTRSGQLLYERERELSLQGRPDPIDALALSADGRSLAAAAFTHARVKTWMVTGLQQRGSRIFGASYPLSLAISPDGSRVATGGNGEGLSANVWTGALDEREMNLRAHLHAVVAAAFSPDGRTLATGAVDASLKLWNLETRRDVVTESLGSEVQAKYLLFSPNGSWLGAADSKGILHLYHAPPPNGS